MNIFGRSSGSAGPQSLKQIFYALMSIALMFATWPRSLAAYQVAQAQSPQPPHAQQTPEQLQQLVAPIALYPDSLVAQILAASTYPEQIVEADRWVQANPDLKDDAFAQAVDQQPWDPSVKALTAFPSVLGNMDKNLSWTSSLGDAYYNQQQDVMDAIQVMRQRAQQAGNLQTTAQQTVTTQGSTVVIQPADPTVVYVPAYDPWVIYGPPIVPWPGWYPYPGIWFGGPYLSFGVGFGIGFYAGYGWGWPGWGFDWGRRTVIYNHNMYYSRSTTFYNRSNYYRGVGSGGGPPGRGYTGSRPPTEIAGRPSAGNAGKPPAGNFDKPGNVYNHPGATPKPFEGNTQAARGYDQPGSHSNTHTSGFSNYDHGGEERSYSSRGSTSFGGGGGGAHGGARPH